MFETAVSKISSGPLLKRRYKAVGRQILVSFGVCPVAAINYETALTACSDEHRISCRGRNALQLTIDALRADGNDAKLSRIFAGCDPKTSSGWDVVRYGLQHGAAGAAAFVVYDVAEAMQMADVYDEARHEPHSSSLKLLSDPVGVIHRFAGPLDIEVDDIIALIQCDGCDDDLDMMQPKQRIADAIVMFLKAANKAAYALRAKAHKARLALLSDITSKQTKRNVTCVYK